MCPLSCSWQVSRARCVIALAALVLGSVGLHASPVGASITYYNQKYGFSLGLPVEVFEPAAAKVQDEGGLWTSRDGQARLLAVAAPTAPGMTLASYRQFVLQQSYQNATIDYAPVRDRWFVLSGHKDGQMFYERVNFACDGRYIYGWQLMYPLAERKRYDVVVEAVHRSYRAGRGEDGKCGRSASAAPR